MSQKRRAGEITEWRRGVGLPSPTSGAEFPLRDGVFWSCEDWRPYKPHVGAFVGEYVSDVSRIATCPIPSRLGVLKPRLEHGKSARLACAYVLSLRRLLSGCNEVWKTPMMSRSSCVCLYTMT